MSSVTALPSNRSCAEDARAYLNEFKQIEKAWFSEYEGFIFSLEEIYKSDKDSIQQRDSYPTAQEIQNLDSEWKDRLNRICSFEFKCLEVRATWHQKISLLSKYCLPHETIQIIKKIDADSGEKIASEVRALQGSLSELQGCLARIDRVARETLAKKTWIEEHPLIYLSQIRHRAGQKKGALGDAMDQLRRSVQRTVSSWTGFTQVTHSSPLSEDS